MQTIRWGILGTAKIAEEQLIPAFQSTEGAELVGVASRDQQRGQVFAHRNGIPQVYASYEALLEDPTIDAVYLPLPNHLHATWTIRAAQHHKHVLCEKPAALNATEARQMIEACQQNNVLFMEAFMYRFHPQWERVDQWLDEGAIGSLRLILVRFSFSLTRPQDIRWSARGGGALYDVGCYCVHLIRSITGDQLPVRVQAVADLNEGGVDRTTVAALAFPKGELAHFDVSFVTADRQSVELVGSEGTLLVTRPFRPDKGSPTLILRTAQGEKTEKMPQGEMYRREVEHFNACIRGEESLLQQPQQTVNNMAMIDAIYQAVGRNT
ncbi:MAG: Gfo/Idh/MocA family oxidoreductase [Firmicutes bacterium]|nr:Gfo/Idh/MocA family oxidoreductase [Bacillota bacterium]